MNHLLHFLTVLVEKNNDAPLLHTPEPTA
ncbi:hypothetical protein MACK_003441 [Theileria orientalis]|uniref:Uncharacterized protein n=1 Tax=Theileria orientalis TaxID=68886 RepID=A0A976XIN2_THEOR|nr:hypothetical protein MACK_003441 [Theileria orientalis]